MVVKVEKKARKTGTESSRRHAFQSFTQKVANIKIDPIRRVRRQVEDEELATHTTSFFKLSLESWIDLNLSTTFTTFAREVTPWTESLPHVLHHQQKIMDALVKSIDEGDDVGLEPLLNLLSQFARDLGVQFEAYFEKAVQTLSRLIVKNKNVEVVEWAFNSLAYLLKYLSRLLVLDLRPLFSILAPLMGKTPQKGHITRFAAEAFSFLLRKTKGDSLNLIVNHIAIDLSQATSLSNPDRHLAKQYQTGLMTLFTDACKGVEYALHSRADVIFSAMLEQVQTLNVSLVWEEVVLGVLTSLIHKTRKETIEPLANAVCSFVDCHIEASDCRLQSFLATLIFTYVGTRKGGRVTSWSRVLGLLESLIGASSELSEDGGSFWLTLRALAVALQATSMPDVVKVLPKVIDAAQSYSSGAYFVPFCDYFSSVNAEKFRELLLPYFQRFIINNWEANENSLIGLIPKLSSANALTGDGSHGTIAFAPSWTSKIEGLFSDLASQIQGYSSSNFQRHVDGVMIAKCSKYLDLLESFPLSETATLQLGTKLEGILGSILSVLDSGAQAEGLQILYGKALNYTVNASMLENNDVLNRSWAVFEKLGSESLFLKALMTAVEHNKYKSTNPMDEKLLETILSKLETNLTTSNHELRANSIDLLLVLSKSNEKADDDDDMLSLMSLIQDTQVNLANSRTMSMHIRKLGILYAANQGHAWSLRVLPYFCFGLLTVKFSAIWEDSIATLSKIAEKKEEIVASLAFGWLQHSNTADSKPRSDSSDSQSGPLTDFECSNMKQLYSSASSCLQHHQESEMILLQEFETDQNKSNVPYDARSQALRVLCAIPSIAEKRSRLLVPMFLEWADLEASEDDTADSDDEEDHTTETNQKWSRKDQSAMLTLFSKFNNPKKLFKSESVYTALLHLLKTGDTKVQSLALKCVFTWKLPGIRIYEDNLNNILDESRFRDEITNFIQVDQDESTIQDDHKKQLMPVLLRLLYGRSLSRKNASSGKRGMESRRTVILASLANFRSSDLDEFISITLGQIDSLNFIDKSNPTRHIFNHEVLDRSVVSYRKQLGSVNMIEDMLKQLGKSLRNVVPKILDALLFCLVGATKSLIDVGEESSESVQEIRPAKSIRQIGFRCLNSLYSLFPEFAWQPYMLSFFEDMVNPRINNFAVETSQSRSGLLQVFSTWAKSPLTVFFLVEYNSQVITEIINCLGIPSVKDDVVQFVLEVIESLVKCAENDSTNTVTARLITPYEDLFLTKMSQVLQKSPTKDVLEKGIEVVSKLSPFVSGVVETRHLVEITTFLLSQPSKRVSPRSKSDILRILLHFLPLCSMEVGDNLFEKTFKITSSLFAYFRDRASREQLARVAKILSQKDVRLVEIASLAEELNSYSKTTLDEPDFDRRLKAFAIINEEKHEMFSARQWMPLVHNMLYFIRDNDELTVRTSASYTLRRFAESCGRSFSTTDGPQFVEILSEVVLPALQNGIRESSELVRMEYLGVMAHIIKECPSWSMVEDMQELLVGGDEEANVFYNILHIQQHRRARAVRRLGEIARKHNLQSANAAHFLIPLLEHFVFDQGEGAHNIATDAINAIGDLAEQLEWPQYRALFRRYVGYIKTKPELERVVVRILSSITDSLFRAATITFNIDQPESSAKPTDHDGDMPMEPKILCHLSTALPPVEKFSNDILNGMLPTLITYLHQKDEFNTSLRIPIAVPIVKLLRVLPDETLKSRLPGVLTDICHILKSRDQGSRDLTRKTLAEITTLLGPQYFGFILKELRGALLRGYQLHVLSYTVHSLLVIMIPTLRPGDLDYCMHNVTAVVMDDVFGATGSEKEAEGYTNKMKEIKSNKSYDSIELLASISTLPYLGELVRPLKAILHEKLNLAMIKKSEELFRRIGVGLLKNLAVKSQELLVFCYEVIQESYKSGEAKHENNRTTIIDPRRQRFLVDLKTPNRRTTTYMLHSHDFKLIKFAFDVMRLVLTKHDSLMTSASLEGFIPIIGDAILSKEEDVQISALRLLTTVIKIPMQALDDGANVFVGQALSFIKSTPNTNAELAQASLKFLSAILRERKAVDIKETTIAYVLTRIRPDLEEPDRQGVTFAFIKSVLSRKIVITEVYDIVDNISAIMVTNQTRNVRDLCRGLYFQFLMEYPQGKSRLKKQLTFLVKNLDYEHQEGRKSVLEAVNLLMTKIGDNLIQDVNSTFFVPLVMVLVNDESSECREMAAVLIKKIFERADDERCQTFLSLLRSWLSVTDKPILKRVSIQLYALYFEVAGDSGIREVPVVVKALLVILEAGTYSNKGIMEDEEEIEWEHLFYAMHTWTKIVQMMPEETKFGQYADIWKAVRGCLTYPHPSVRLSSARLVGLFFAEFKDDQGSLPLDNGKGLTITGIDMIGIARACSGQLNTPELTDELGLQTVRNLVFLGKCFYLNKLEKHEIRRPDDGDRDGSDGHDNELDEDSDDNEDVEKNEGDQEHGEVNVDKSQSALSWLIGRISGVIRNERIQARKNILGKKYAIQWLAAILQFMSPEDTISLSSKMIMPLYNLNETENENLKDIKTLAQEVSSMISTHIGTTAYSTAYAAVRAQVQERRRVRKYKRSIQLVTEPERAAKRKIRKHERTKESRKEKSRVFRDTRRAKFM